MKNENTLTHNMKKNFLTKKVMASVNLDKTREYLKIQENLQFVNLIEYYLRKGKF